ncbi:hypothetical protein OQA88_10886 [Cercophora sp. LCS_1]
MSLLTTSTSKPGVALHQGPNVISSLGPLVKLALQFQRLLGSATFILAVRTYLAATLIGRALLFASHVAALRTLILSKAIAFKSIVAVRQLAWSLWNSKQSRRVRKKIEFEFFVLFLGPANVLCLMLFWPGWLVLGAAAWALTWR